MADIETLATGTVEKLIAKTDYLVPYIAKKDRGPSFDGYICAYRKKGGNHPKNDCLGQAWVQIKGCECKAIGSGKKKFSVSLTDIRLYLQEGGVLFFVVYIAKDDDSEIVYYRKLLPYDLKKILKEHGEQKSYSIELKQFPQNKEGVSDLVINFIRDRDKQRVSIHSEDVTVNQLEIDGKMNGLSFGYSSTSIDENFPMDYLMNHDFYIYADIGYGLEIPIEHIDKFEAAITVVPKKICVKNKQYYSSYKIQYKSGMRQICIGGALKLTENAKDSKLKVEFIPEGTLGQCINDEEFLSDAVENNEIIIEGMPIRLTDNVDGLVKKIDIDKLKQHLQYLRKVKDVLLCLHVKKELQLSSIEKKDELNIARLISAIDEKNLVELKDTGKIIGKYIIGNIKLLMFAIKDKDSGLFKLYDFFDSPIEASGIDQDNKEFASTPCVHLTAENLLEYDNIDCTIIMERIRKVPYTIQFENQLTIFLLQIIKACDLNGLPLKEYMELAGQVNEYIKTKSVAQDKSIIILNDMQLKRRTKGLSSQDIEMINHVIQRAMMLHNERILAGAYLILNRQEEAQKHYNLLTKEEQKEFDEFPICRYKEW